MNTQMRRHSFIFVVIAVLLVSMPGASWGNGVYVPQQGYPVMPTIPVQRAIIVYRDGVQTLVVESAFQTEAKDVAWILPLPAVPVKLAVCGETALPCPELAKAKVLEVAGAARLTWKRPAPAPMELRV